MIYFNVLLVTYNIVFFIYGCMSFAMDGYPYLILFLPFISGLQMIITIDFIGRYYKLAEVISIFFTNDIQKQLKATTVRAIKCQKIKYWTVILLLHMLTLTGTALKIYGNYCIVSAE